MVQVSKAAGTVLLDSLLNASVPAETGYRLASSQGGNKLRMDRPSTDDRVVRREGHVVFMVEPELDEQLEGVVLDLKDRDRERLVLEVL